MTTIQRTDLGGIATFLGREHLSGDPAWRPTGMDGPEVCWRHEGRVVGVARLSRYWLHPARWRLAIHVETGSRRQGIGSALLDALMDALPVADGSDLQAVTSASDEIAIAFLRSQGFDLLMTTRLGQLDADTVPDLWLQRASEARLALSREGIEIVTLAAAPDRFRETALLHERIYRAQHAWNPPVTISPERADVAFLDPAELDPARQWLAIRDDVAIGVGSLRRTDDPERVDLGWLGVMKEQAHRRVALCRTMVGTCLASIRGQGMTVSLEIDAIDPEVDALIDELPVGWNDAWLTWRKGKTSRRLDSGNRQNVG